MKVNPGGWGDRIIVSMPTPADIKRALVKAGFEVYQTRGDVVHVAERVRENLLMDSGVRVEANAPTVRFVVRAQRNDFPNDPDDQLFQRARTLAVTAVDRGYREVETTVTQVFDPGDSGRTLDTWCEVAFEKPVADVEIAMDEVRFVLTLEKAVTRR